MPVALLLGTADECALKCAYDPVVVELLKETVPYADRQWDAVKKMWRLQGAYASVIKTMLETHGVTVVDRRRNLGDETAESRESAQLLREGVTWATQARQEGARLLALAREEER